MKLKKINKVGEGSGCKPLPERIKVEKVFIPEVKVELNKIDETK